MLTRSCAACMCSGREMCRNWIWSRRRNLPGIIILYEVSTSGPGMQRVEEALGICLPWCSAPRGLYMGHGTTGAFGLVQPLV